MAKRRGAGEALPRDGCRDLGLARGGLHRRPRHRRPHPVRQPRRHPRPAAQPPPDRAARPRRRASRSSATSNCSPAPGPSCRRTRWSGSPAPTASRPPPRWSTTSSRPRACRATMGGNIGLPILAQDPLPEGGVYVLELSSYQIDLTQSLDCDVAVLLNITPDHLDRYESFEAYAASKARLFEMQSAGIVGCRRRRSRRCSRRSCSTDASASMTWFTADRDRSRLSDQSDWPALQGPHNAAECCGRDRRLPAALGIDDDADRAGPPHLPRPAAPHGARPREGRRHSSSTTARRPTRPRPRRRWPLSRRSAGSSAGRPRPTISTNARRTSAMSARPTPSARRRELFARLLAPHMPVKDCRNAGRCGAKRPRRMHEPGDTVLLSPACA